MHAISRFAFRRKRVPGEAHMLKQGRTSFVKEQHRSQRSERSRSTLNVQKSLTDLLLNSKAEWRARFEALHLVILHFGGFSGALSFHSVCMH